MCARKAADVVSEVTIAMKVALILFSILATFSFWFGPQGTLPDTCRGKSLPIKMLHGPKMTGSLPLRFGGTRPFPGPPIDTLPTGTKVHLVIKDFEEFAALWNRIAAKNPPGDWKAPPPQIDFSKEMVIISALGSRPTSGYWTIIDGACEVDNQLEVFITNVEDTSCVGQVQIRTYPADAVRIPRSDLPVVFRETEIPCTEWIKQFQASQIAAK